MHFLGIEVFRKSVTPIDPKKYVKKAAETTIKVFWLLTYPAIVAAGVSIFWYYVLFCHHVHFDERLTEVAVAAWIPTFGILYGLFAAVVLNTVWSEYKDMRMAIKCYDIQKFMNLRDEDVSPLVHVMMAILSWSVLSVFMLLSYPDALSGILCVSTTAFLLGLIFFVVRQIDDPLSGIWFIKNVHKEWMEIDVKQWREAHYASARITIDKEIEECVHPGDKKAA
jgi:uncharacterized membrane protein YcfT